VEHLGSGFQQHVHGLARPQLPGPFPDIADVASLPGRLASWHRHTTKGQLIDARRSTVELSWGPVSYLEWCNSPTSFEIDVVLLHGGGVDSAVLSWGGLGPRLAAAGYRVLAPDHPGYGQSPAAPWPATQQRLVGYVGEFVDAATAGSHVIAGLSLGAGMAIGHTLARPAAVRGAMLLGSYGLMPRLSDGPLSLPRQMLTWALLRCGLLDAMTRGLAASSTGMAWSVSSLVRDPAQRTPALMDQVMAAARSGHGFEAFAQWQREQILWNRLATDYRAQLPGFGPPALIVHGDRDSGVPVARAREAAALIAEAELKVVAGAGHWVQRDRPDAVAAAMIGFLHRVSATG
jgi:pimeloyl-ACP methyl ester carboxylesterase